MRLVLILTVIALAAGLLLAATHAMTKGPIAQAERNDLLKSLKKVLPEYTNEPDKDTYPLKPETAETGTATGDKPAWLFYIARKQEQIVGVAFVCASDEGYGGRIEVLVGVLPDNTIGGVEVLKHGETPGLGAKIRDESFRSQFAKLDITKTNWGVKKDGGDIDAITGATISSRAVVSAVKRGVAAYQEHEKAIRETAP